MSGIRKFTSFGSELKSLFPFISGWVSLLMFDQGKKLKKAGDENLAVKLTIMILLTISYVHDVKIAIWVFLSYFVLKVAVLDIKDWMEEL